MPSTSAVCSREPMGDQRMNAALGEIPQHLLHQIRAGRKRSST